MAKGETEDIKKEIEEARKEIEDVKKWDWKCQKGRLKMPKREIEDVT